MCARRDDSAHNRTRKSRYRCRKRAWFTFLHSTEVSLLKESYGIPSCYENRTAKRTINTSISEVNKSTSKG